jgi:hypothetical protein
MAGLGSYSRYVIGCGAPCAEGPALVGTLADKAVLNLMTWGGEQDLAQASGMCLCARRDHY